MAVKELDYKKANFHYMKNAVFYGAMDNAVLLRHKKRLEDNIVYWKKQIESLNDQIEIAEIIIKQIIEKTGAKNEN